MQDDFRDYVPKHLARNVPEDFSRVCDRIRHREQIHLLKRPKKGAPKYFQRYQTLLAVLQGVDTAEPTDKDFHIGQELDEIRIRFLAITKAVDQTVSVKLVFEELKKAQKILHKVVQQLNDPNREDLIQYYSDVHPEGQGFATRSKTNILTVYGADLKVDFETDLSATPEVAAGRRRLDLGGEGGILWGEPHLALNCIALSPRQDRYLYTRVDEAWCIDRD